jgi:preprotein translocase subunit SecA
MIDKIIALFFGTKHERDVKRMKPLVKTINALEDEMKSKDNDDLKAKSIELRKRHVENGETLDQLLPEAFALVRETAWRILGMRHYDVQLMGGMVLHQGKIAEMKTGEGKTLVATLAMYLNALSGKGCHLVTVNDYLARRDADWMRPVYEFLGLTVGVIQHNMNHTDRQHAYGCDITYGTNNEFGFDYLRDNMVEHHTLKVQRKLNFCIVDEVDSILIDEARTPLIISGSIEESTKKYYEIDKIIPYLKADIDYEVNEKDRNVTLTEDGVHHVEKLLRIENLFDNRSFEIVHYVNQALKAHTLFTREVDYIVKDGKVVIVDEFTGRLMEGRRYSDGLHQALEAKERVTIARESQTLASVTFQNFFRMYEKLSGMTGTADTEAVEFNNIYKLDVVVVPTNKPVIRKDQPDVIYKSESGKFKAIADDIAESSLKGQPILVGTISIEKSELLSQLLKKRGINHNVLNAKYHEREAQIVAEAGSPGMVTIATNMAGRGTDIVLGGKKIHLDEIDEYQPAHTPELWEKFKNAIMKSDFDTAESLVEKLEGKDKAKAQHIIRSGREWKANNTNVLEAGGLYILGTERHEARRIDNQLRGRAGRQGDPGKSRFYLALDDNLMRIFGGERINAWMERMGMDDEQQIESKMVSKQIEGAQKRVEGRNYEIRKHLLEYDDVMNSQREFIYQKRNEILMGEDISNTIEDYFIDTIEDAIEAHSNGKNHPDEWDVESLSTFLTSKLHPSLTLDRSELKKMRYEEIVDMIHENMRREYERKESEIGKDNMRHLERMISLQIIDTKWREHLYQMDELREGIWTVGYGQKQPLVEYKLRGFEIFQQMIESLKLDITEFIMKVQVNKVEIPKEEPVEYTPVGNEMHDEVEQFGTGGIPTSAGSISRNPNRERKHNEPVVGGSKRKKSRRSRRR